GFFAQAKKGGSRRHGAKALDLDVGERAAGQDPPDGASAGQLAGQDPPYEAAVAVLPTRRDQEQLAALAAHRRPFPFRAARRAITTDVRAWRTGLRRSEAGAVHLRDLQRGQ